MLTPILSEIQAKIFNDHSFQIIAEHYDEWTQLETNNGRLEAMVREIWNFYQDYIACRQDSPSILPSILMRANAPEDYAVMPLEERQQALEEVVHVRDGLYTFRAPAWQALQRLRTEWADKINWEQPDDFTLQPILEQSLNCFRSYHLAALALHEDFYKDLIACLPALTPEKFQLVVQLFDTPRLKEALDNLSSFSLKTRLLEASTKERRDEWFEAHGEAWMQGLCRPLASAPPTGLRFAKFLLAHRLAELTKLFPSHCLSTIHQCLEQTPVPQHLDEEDKICCPITGDVMTRPVRLPSGQICEHKAIVRWIKKKGTNPFTRQILMESQLQNL